MRTRLRRQKIYILESYVTLILEVIYGCWRSKEIFECVIQRFIWLEIYFWVLKGKFDDDLYYLYMIFGYFSQKAKKPKNHKSVGNWCVNHIILIFFFLHPEVVSFVIVYSYEQLVEELKKERLIYSAYLYILGPCSGVGNPCLMIE